MTKLVLALLLAGSCWRSPPQAVIESPCNCSEGAPSCPRRGKWVALVARAIEATARHQVGVSQKQAAAIVDWYCVRDNVKPRSNLHWMASDENEVGEAEFWKHAKSNSYDIRYGSSVSASRDRETFGWAIRDQNSITTKVTLDTIHGGGDSGPMPFWIHFYFDDFDKLVGANVGSGSACPYITTSFDGGAYVEHGEILRNLWRPALEATQQLATPGPAQCRRVVVRVSERKPETTYLDSLELDVDGTRIAPTGCPGAAYCADDGTYQRLERDTSIDLAFALPAGVDCRSARVVANGHYVPYAP